MFKINKWNFCGTKGDSSAQDLFPILEYLLECNPNNIDIRTNGGARHENFWKRVGELFFEYKLQSCLEV